MIYLKFKGKQSDPSISRTICTKDYSCAKADGLTRVYYETGFWEAVGPNDWLACFVMSETGKTIDRVGQL